MKNLFKDAGYSESRTREFATRSSQQEGSYFATPTDEIIPETLLQTIKTSAHDVKKLDEEIKQAFAKAKQAGHKKPILMGAIPFNTHQPSCLCVFGGRRKKQNIDDTSGYSSTVTLNPDMQQQTCFKDNVDKALHCFDRQIMEKVVLSRVLKCELEHDTNPFGLGKKLKKQNPSAYVFSLPVENEGVLIGASPELLLSKKNGSVKSNPLAGSKPISKNEEENTKNKNTLQQSRKDLFEHRLVVNSVASNLAPFCRELSITEDPKILYTPTMMHLSSELEGVARKDTPSSLAIALNLHPTPAICGTPMHTAKEFILNNEAHDRGFYCGLVGWMDDEGNGEWIVTIRCGLMQNKHLQLYAGAGVVKGSCPQAEWDETEAKLKTMLNAIVH